MHHETEKRNNIVKRLFHLGTKQQCALLHITDQVSCFVNIVTFVTIVIFAIFVNLLRFGEVATRGRIEFRFRVSVVILGQDSEFAATKDTETKLPSHFYAASLLARFSIYYFDYFDYCNPINQ